MKAKKDGQAKEAANGNAPAAPMAGEVKTSADLKAFLKTVRDGMSSGRSPAVVAMSAVNHILNRPDIGQLLDSDSKEIARDIWLRLKQSGLQVRNPPILFENGQDAATGG